MDFPIKNGGSFHWYVSSPEGIIVVKDVGGFITHDGSIHGASILMVCHGSHQEIPHIYVSIYIPAPLGSVMGNSYAACFSPVQSRKHIFVVLFILNCH